MSTRIPLFLFLLACAPAVSSAQDATPPPAAPPAAAPPLSPLKPNLTQKENDQLMAARKQAMQDPDVIAAIQKEKDAAEKLRQAMLADNPSLGPTLDKLKESPGGGPPPQLTSDERDQVIAERNKLQGTPEADAMKQSVLNFRATLRAAILKADPTLSPVLDRIDAAMQQAQAAAAAAAGPKP